MSRYNNYAKCPVCGKSLFGALCNNCGYLRIIYPSVIPDKLKVFESRRVECMQKARLSLDSLSSHNPAPSAKDDARPVGTLVVRNLMTESHFIFPIYPGMNVYGDLDSNNPSHHHIDPSLVGIDIPDKMFSISAPADDEFWLFPEIDFPLSANRLKISSPTPIDNNYYFFYSNLIFFNAVKF